MSNINRKNSQNIEDINVHVDLQNARLTIEQDGRNTCSKKFRKYDSITDCTSKMFSKKLVKAIKKHIYNEYKNRHSFISKSAYLQKKVKKRINKNIDISVYQILWEYDIRNSNKTQAHIDYAEAMLKNVKRRYKESLTHYKKRETEFRKNYLEKNHINIKYNVKHPVLLENQSLLDYFSALKNVFKFSKFADLSIYDKPLHNISNRGKKLIKGVSKGKSKYTAPKGLKEKLSKKAKKILLATSALAAVAIVTGDSLQHTQQKTLAYDNNSTKMETLAKSINGDMRKHTTSNLSMIIKNNFEKVIIEQKANTKVQENKQNEKGKIVLKDALIENLEIDFNSEFFMTEGKFYESPNGTGNFGNYEEINGPLKFNKVDVIDQNGIYHSYTIKDGKNLAEIKAMNPNATIVYHVTSKENLLGWNKSTENDIENNIVKGSIAKLKPYLSQETMKFLCNTGLDETIDKNENEKYLDEIHNAMNKYKEDNSLDLQI